MNQPLGTFDPGQQVTVLSVGGTSFQAWEVAHDNNAVREVFSRESEQSRGTIRLVMDWAQRLPFAAAMLGGAFQTAGGVFQLPPLAYPDAPGWICLSIDCRPIAPQGVGSHGFLTYQYADLNLHFGPPPFFPGQFTLGVLEMSTQSNAIALDQAQPAFYWDTGATEPLPPTMAPALRWTSTLLKLARTDQPTLPIATVQNLVDKTNAADFYGYPAETVLFHGAESKWRPTMSPDPNKGGSIVVYDVSYMVEAHSIVGGWGKAYNPATSSWASFYKKDGTKLFPTADFTPLTA